MNRKLDFIFSRRSVRKFDGDAVPEAALRDLLEAAMAAPSACARDPWRFVVVRDKDRLARMAEGLPNGPFLAQAGAGIVVCGDLAAAHGQLLSYLLQDCGAAIQNLLLAARALGLGSCWLGVHPREERMAHLRGVLGIPEEVLPVGIVALGAPAEQKEPRTRYADEKVYRESWRR